MRRYADEVPVDLAEQGFDEELRGLPGAYAPPRGRLWLAYLGRVPVGCVGLRPRGSDTGEVKRLYVLPRARGRGVSRGLMRALVAWASRAGYRRLLLDTLPTMRAAQSLYRSMGFRRTRPYYPSPFPGTAYFALRLRRRARANGPR